MSKSVAETEHLKEMLVGNILTVSWREVRATAMVYGVIGAFHYPLPHKFLSFQWIREAPRSKDSPCVSWTSSFMLRSDLW
jgi:hypothetical protein